MRIERVFLEKITTVQLNIGYVGEHDHCRVIIDSASILAYYPNAVAGMVAKSPAGVLYPVALLQDGNDVIWNVSDSDLARAGIGTFQLTFTQNGEIIKTAHGSYKVDPSLIAEGDPPDPIETWIDEANQKLADVTEAVQDATEAAENADSKASEAEAAASDATAAAALANEKATLADQKATLADTAASSANTAAASATSAASSATSAASSATSAASSANTAASTANTAAGKIDNMTVAASSSQTPTATITEVDGHKHILFGLVKGDAGKDFHIAKTFSSIAQMMAYTGSDVEPYDFAMIDTGSVQDPDTGKLYCYEPDKTPKWQYIGDLSGAQGIKGETGTGISSIALNQDYTLTIYLDDGTSYTTTSIRGAKGDQGDPGTPGAPGDPGPAGQNAYVYIRYSTSEPVQDSDMHTTPDNWMGIYSGTSSTAPTAYTDYAWYKIKGETGSATNVYGTTVPMSEQDSTKVATAIGTKLNSNQGSGNAGKFMKVGNDGSLVPDTVPDPTGKADKVTNATSGNFAGLDSNGNLTDSGSKASDFLTQHQDISGKADKVSNATSGNFAGLDSNGNLTDSGSKASDFLTQHQDISGKVDKNQGVAHAGKALGINAQGMVEPVTFSGYDFTGATSSTAGTHGYVPAPAATDNTKYLKGDGTWADVLPSVTSSDNGKSLEVINGEWTTGNEKIDKHFDIEKFEEKTWTGLTSFNGFYVWTDGENIYYSYNANQYVLDKSTSTWSAKTWTGLTSFNGMYIWTDGKNIYYSSGTDQYVLDKSTSTWSFKTWTGLTDFGGSSVWTDGENIYYSNSVTQYVLDKSTSTWSAKTWTGLTSFYGNYVWTDGKNIYYSNGTTQYILNKSTSTWSAKTWTGLTSFNGFYVWTDGENIYYSNSVTQYVLDKSTSTWSAKTWTGLTSFNGMYIWTDGKNIYYSNSSSQYKLNNIYILLGRNGTFVPVSISDVVSSPVTMTGADGANAGTAGYVPAPAAGDQDKVLHGDGTWKTALNNNLYPEAIEVAGSIASAGIVAYKIGSMVIMMTTSNGVSISSTGIQLPSNLIPKYDVAASARQYSSGWVDCWVNLRPTGYLTMMNTSGAISVTYERFMVIYEAENP